MTTVETKGEKGKRERRGQRVGIETGRERMGSKRKRWLVFGRVRKRKLGGEIEVNGARVMLKDLTESCAVRAGPGVSPASPWARATPHPRATNWPKKFL